MAGFSKAAGGELEASSPVWLISMRVEVSALIESLIVQQMELHFFQSESTWILLDQHLDP
jgi:hypothetical protein